MKYPIEILPNTNFKIIECNLAKYKLIRYTNSNNPEEIFDKSVNQIKQAYIIDPSKGMNDLSTNLLGIFLPKHVQIELTDFGKRNYNKYWTEGFNVSTPIYHSDFIYNSQRGYFTLLIEEINGVEVNYKKGNSEDVLKATSVVEHSPMLWNFWHFSIRWKLEDGNYWHLENPSQMKSLGKLLGHETRSIIAMFAKIEIPHCDILKKNDYCKNT